MFTEPEIIGIVLGIVGIVIATIAIFIPFLIERLKRPHLIVRIENEIHVAGQPIRFLHGKVISQPHLKFLRWIVRYPAYDCRVVLIFYRDTQTILGPIETKWTSAPECLTPIVQLVLQEQAPGFQINNISTFDSTKTVFAHVRTILSNPGGERFDLVIKNQAQSECYAFTGWSYRFPNFADPNLVIPKGTFTVQIEAIATNGRSEVTSASMRNEGSNTNDITVEISN